VIFVISLSRFRISKSEGLVGGFKEYPIIFAPRYFSQSVNQEPMNPV